MTIAFTILSSIFDLFVIMSFLNGILGSRRKEIPSWMFFAAFALVEIALAANSYLIPSSASFANQMFTIGLSFLTTFLLCLLYATKLRNKIFAAISFQMLSALGEGVFTIIIAQLNPGIFEMSDKYLLNAFMDLGSKLFIFIFSLICISLWKKAQPPRPILYNVLVFSTPVITAIILFAIPTKEIANETAGTFYPILYAAFTVLNILNYYLLKDLVTVADLKYRTSQLEMSIGYQKEKYEQLNLSYRNSRRIVHDMKHHYNTIEKLVQEGRNDELLDYLKDSINKIELHYTKYNTGNLVIDTLLNNYDALAASLNIPFQAELHVDANKVPIKDYDLCIILGNLLDNCLNACKKLPTCDTGIKIMLSTTDTHVLISTENKIPASTDDAAHNQLVHGFGIENIRTVINAYKGMYKVFDIDNTYKASIAIPIFRKEDSNIRFVSFQERESNDIMTSHTCPNR